MGIAPMPDVSGAFKSSTHGIPWRVDRGEERLLHRQQLVAAPAHHGDRALRAVVLAARSPGRIPSGTGRAACAATTIRRPTMAAQRS